MKKIIATAFFTALLSTSAFAAKVEVGTYVEKTTISIAYIQSKEECKSEGGKWDVETDVCRHSSENDVIITKSNNVYAVSVSTIGTNVHTCDFAAEAQVQQDGSLLSKVQTDDGLCVVQVRASNKLFSKGVSVAPSENCRSFCGARASLEVVRAKKVK